METNEWNATRIAKERASLEAAEDEMTTVIAESKDPTRTALALALRSMAETFQDALQHMEETHKKLEDVTGRAHARIEELTHRLEELNLDTSHEIQQLQEENTQLKVNAVRYLRTASGKSLREIADFLDVESGAYAIIERIAAEGGVELTINESDVVTTRIKIARRARGFSAERLADIVGVRPCTLEDFPMTQPGSLDILIRTAIALNTTPDFLLGFQTQPAPETEPPQITFTSSPCKNCSGVGIIVIYNPTSDSYIRKFCSPCYGSGFEPS